MVKIIKEGKIPTSYLTIYKTECSRCNCVFEFTLDECTSMERRLDGDVTIECPCCHNSVRINRNNLVAIRGEHRTI